MRNIDKDFAIRVGKKIRNARHMAGMTLEQLASKVGIAQQQLGKYEQGVNRVSFQMLCELSRHIKLDDMAESLSSRKPIEDIESTGFASSIRKFSKLDEMNKNIVAKVIDVCYKSNAA